MDTIKKLSVRLIILILAILSLTMLFGLNNKVSAYEYEYVGIESGTLSIPSGKFYCIQEGYEFQPGEYYKSSSYSVGNDFDKTMIAYIIDSGSSKNIKQHALWAIVGYGGTYSYKIDGVYPYKCWTNYSGSSYCNWRTPNKMGANDWSGTGRPWPSWMDLYVEAYDYAKSHSGSSSSISANINGRKTTCGQNEVNFGDEGIIVGPYKVKYTTSGVNYTVTTNLNEDEAWISDSNGNPISIPNDTNFYITVNPEYMQKYSEGTVTINYSYTYNKPTKKVLTSATEWRKRNGGGDQRIVTFETGEEGGSGSGSGSVTLKIPKLIPELKLHLEDKVDQVGNSLTGASFTVTAIQGGSNLGTNNLNRGTITFQPRNTSPIVVSIKETNAPNGYKKLDNEIQIKFELENGEWVLSDDTNLEQKGLVDVDMSTSNNAGLIIEDQAKIDKFTLNKVDKTDNTPLNNTKFRVSFEELAEDEDGNTDTATNVESYNGIAYNGGSFEIRGNETIRDIVVIDNNNPVVVTLEEIESEKGYRMLENPITITLSDIAKGTFEIETDDEENSSVTKSGNNATVKISNIPMMLVGGIVYNDGQIGEGKEGNLIPQNGIYNEGEGLAGVKVELFNSAGQKVAETYTADEGEEVEYVSYKDNTSAENYEPRVKVLKKGEYFFHEITELGEENNLEYLPKDNYTIVFTYNGQKFTTVAKQTGNNASKADENTVQRTAVNNRYATITAGEDYFYTDKENISEVYDANVIMYKAQEYDEEEIEEGTEPEVGASWDGNSYEEVNVETEVLDSFVVTAKAEASKTNWQNVWKDDGNINDSADQLNINCGLRERKLDMSLTADVNNVDVKINGKETKYNYAQVINDEVLTKLGEKKSDDVAVDYSQLIYESDYNYRIDDYNQALTDNNVNVNDKDEIVSELNGKITTEDELKIFVTYKFKVKVQEMTENGSITVDELKIYFDPTTYKYVDDPSNNGEITLSMNGLSKSNTSQEKEITFEVIVPEGKTAGEVLCTGKVRAEISKYSTSDGLIDRDSKPGNINETNAQKAEDGYHYEDDTDLANGITYSLAKNVKREISGYVWNDSNRTDDNIKYEIGNGEKADSEEAINDVIVQLIEIKQIDLLGSMYNLEYIWQETRTGSKDENVKRISYGNDEITSYDNGEHRDGYYKFTDFIPGNYIVRFIYGDGSTYDVTPNVTKYNGQDYKSTKFDEYKSAAVYDGETYYNMMADAEGNYEDKSVARDNEARRLEVMAYSTLVNNEIGTKIKDKKDDMLANTWMCAETLLINIPVDADNLETDDDGTEVQGLNENQTKEDQVQNQHKDIIFDKVNFGIELRPVTKIELEKHITELSVNTESGKILLDAKTNIDDILDDNIISEKQGVTKGLTTIVSERANRGFWKLETDLSELGQGSELNATYTYVVKNIGDDDYLSNELIEEYESGDMEYYSESLRSLATSVKEFIQVPEIAEYTTGDYLGKFYYTGTQDETTDAKVPTQVTKLQEALNDKFAFADENYDFMNIADIDDYDDSDSAYVKNSKNPTLSANQRTIFRNNPPIRKQAEPINTIVQTSDVFDYLVPNANDTKDINLQATITTDGGYFDSYIGEITEYTNAAGRVDMKTTPENLSYVHSDDNNRNLDAVGQDTLGAYPDEVQNERDEFWGETIIISKPTGEDKTTVASYIIISAIGIAVIGVGIVLIKKFAIKK